MPKSPFQCVPLYYLADHLCHLTALLITFLLGPRVIRLLRRHQIGQHIREEAPVAFQ
jgi:UDP-N-acetylmuramyl pentapeptide phosphotransferase/UDP-N-acetylglucosamine-1-phosphate transferase